MYGYDNHAMMAEMSIQVSYNLLLQSASVGPRRMASSFLRFKVRTPFIKCCKSHAWLPTPRSHDHMAVTTKLSNLRTAHEQFSTMPASSVAPFRKYQHQTVIWPSACLGACDAHQCTAVWMPRFRAMRSAPRFHILRNLLRTRDPKWLPTEHALVTLRMFAACQILVDQVASRVRRKDAPGR